MQKNVDKNSTFQLSVYHIVSNKEKPLFSEGFERVSDFSTDLTLSTTVTAKTLIILI